MTDAASGHRSADGDGEHRSADGDGGHRSSDADDLGLFGPHSVTWRVHDEPILIVAGLRSLYLQALHPRAIAGVAQNSHYRADPFGRLMRTSIYVATTVWGTTAEANAAAARIRRLHARLRATDPATGVEFRIDEPELLRWVHVTEVESFLSTATRAGLDLTPAEIDRYYAEQRRSAELIGLDPATVPGSAAEVATYYRAVRPQLRMTRDAADTALFLTAPPVPGQLSLPWRIGLGFGPPRLAYLGVAATATGLLPAWARRMYGGPGLPTTDVCAAVSARGLRLALRAVPRSLVEGPIRQAARRRAEQAARDAEQAGPARDGAEQAGRDGGPVSPRPRPAAAATG
ncbi:oxygenase MpaB family protein [Solwaraspora sp. WMMA2056]|uniref:oxygenase MpaB family protein n=1 Tax=Solwaraspora sp. WMMA2056 TaxID=3015161 RepID=UPI00259B7BD9|nr:oxygenase MpaB family protein [Solwaraspora sp. WMMA2056]WJK40857.1 oxygenase MpaB family protein [Solwaraspora sp. WMMA2056]